MRRIVLVATESILDVGVRTILSQEADLTVAEVEYLNDRQFLDEVAAARPDVILLIEDEPLGLPQVLDLVLQIPSLTNTRIITFRFEDSMVRVLDYQRILLAKNAELVSLIHMNE